MRHEGTWLSPGRVRRLVLAVIAGAATAGAPAVAAAAPAGAIGVGAAYRNSNPKVLVDRAGAIHVVYLRETVPGTTFEVRYARRAAGAATFEADRPITLPGGVVPVDAVMREDPVGNRLLLFVNSNAPAVWVFTSSDGGTTWSAGANVWDYFSNTDFVVQPGTGRIAVTSGQIGVDRLMIEPGLGFTSRASTLPPAGNQLELTTRIVSRLEVAQAFGADGTSYTMFEGSTGGYVHVGSANPQNNRSDFGLDKDKLVLGSANANLSIAGGAKGAGVLAADSINAIAPRFHLMSPAGPGAAVALPMPAGETSAVFSRLYASPEGSFYAVWRAAAGTVMTRSDDAGATWAPLRVMATNAEGGDDVPIASDSDWSVGGAGSGVGAYAYRDRANVATVVPFDPKATGTTPTPPAPAPPAPAPLKFTALKGPGSVKAAVLARTGVVFRVSLSRAGTVTLRVLRGKKVLITRKYAGKGGTNALRLKTAKLAKGTFTFRFTLPGGATRTVTVKVR